MNGYSIESHLKAAGLSFDALDIVEKTFKVNGVQKLRGKVVGRLGSELRREYANQNGEKDINAVSTGCYCIGIGGEYQIRYSDGFASRVVYIGSGNVYGRLKSHLKDKLFDFAHAMRGIPLTFHIADLRESKLDHKNLEQMLLDKFKSNSGGSLPLLNKNNAVNKAMDSPSESKLKAGWDKPLHKDKGKQVAKWLIEPRNFDEWKGILD
ncbi:hypothetical protein [Roseovarius azorensis]|uniref:hypothetical protein n=1 Tax=Roseovarius azorensis TaxID=1287727 RepID=UPI001114F620|nr:hypothetical protein [Roseovarius azorensis]